MSARRAARAQAAKPAASGVSAKLAAGPDAAVWGGGLFGARRAWKDARNSWMAARGMDPREDYRLLPPELRDRGPFDSRELAEDMENSDG
jgi:hypothetical protein